MIGMGGARGKAWLAAACLCAQAAAAATAAPPGTGTGFDPAASLGKARWIWDAGDTGASKHHVCWFRRTFILADGPVAGRAAVTADNAYELFVNGSRVGGDVSDPAAHWNKAKRHDIGPFLRKGANAIAIRGINAGGAGGVVAAFRVEAGDAGLDLVTDDSWRKTTSHLEDASRPDLDDRAWKPADVIGPMGVAPWGWLDGRKAPALAAARSAPPAEPPTRTLGAEEAEALLEAEWLYQAAGAPIHERALQEIAWAREVVGRLANARPAPELATELARLDGLERDLRALPAAPDAAAARALYLEVRRVKRAVLFKDPAVDFSGVVFIDVPERYAHESMHRVYPQAQLNCVRLLVLDGLHPGGAVRKLTDSLGAGWYWRPEVSFDARRVLFCFRPEKDRTFHLYEANLDGSNLRQITHGSYDDQDPIYLPDGRIAFMSNRGNSYARCTVGHPSTVLTRCDADGGNIYILSGGGEPEYTPSLMSDGRILYTRWEYTDKELMRIQSLWTVNPDGTGTGVFWGNQSYWPDMLMEARQIPGSHRVMFAGHGHHQVYRGSVGILDRTRGLNYPDGLSHVTWDTPWPEVGNGPAERMETPRYHAAGSFGGYKSPYPLSADLFLVSARHGTPASSPFRLYLMDTLGNRELVYAGAFNVLYAMPVKPRPVPPALPDQVAWAGRQADAAPVEPGHFYSADIFRGAPEVLRGKAKFLRVLSLDATTFTLGKKLQDVDHPGAQPHMHVGPVMSVACNDGVKRVLGTVPIEADGSVCFEAPPCRAIHFQLLDANHRALHTMRSFANLMPGERRGCVGCHATHSVAPAANRGLAMRKEPSRIAPYPWGTDHSFGYERDIQPILDRNCGRCHQGSGRGRAKLDLTLRPSADFGAFPEPYVTLVLGAKRRVAGGFPGVCEGGIADTILAEAHPWRPEDYGVLDPMTKLSGASRLIELASGGRHHDVKLDPESLLKLVLWVDTICPYRGEPEVRAMADPDPNDPLFKKSNYPPSDVTVEDVYAQSPYRPRMRTAPVVNRAYRQDEFPDVESRLPRDARGDVVPPVAFTPDGHRVETPWPPPKAVPRRVAPRL